MKKIIILCMLLAAIFSLSGCFYTEEDIDEIQYNAWEEGYDDGWGDGYDEGYEDGYASGYNVGGDDALHEYGIEP